MKIELEGHDEVAVGTGAHEVADTLADPEQLLDLLDGMLRPSSTAERWVMAEMQAGPVRLTPAVDVEVERGSEPGGERDDDRRVAIVGRPVPGHTPAHLDLTLVMHGDQDGHCTIRSRWDVSVDVPGPQFLASTIHPLMQASSRRVTRQLADRLRARFDPPPR